MQPRIARLYADNYRCFAGFELKPGLRNLLVGGNGSGKSSVFDVIDAVRHLLIGNCEVVEAFPSATVAKVGGSTGQTFELDVVSEHGLFRHALHLSHDLEQGVAAITSEEVTLEGKPLYRFADGVAELYGDDHAPTGRMPSISPKRSFLAQIEPGPKARHLTWFKELFAGMWTLRINPASIEALSRSDDDVLTPDASNFASFCRHLLQVAPDGVQRAQETLREVLPGFQNLRMQAAGRGKVLTATFRYPGGQSYDLDFDMLSEGQKVLIVLYVVLHSHGRRLSVLCLDEPDNFVSIREIQPFLVELADISDETGLQALVISHSSEVIDYFGVSEAILLERPEGGPTRVGTIAPGESLRLSELMARGWHVAR